MRKRCGKRRKAGQEKARAVSRVRRLWHGEVGEKVLS